MEARERAVFLRYMRAHVRLNIRGGMQGLTETDIHDMFATLELPAMGFEQWLALTGAEAALPAPEEHLTEDEMIAANDIGIASIVSAGRHSVMHYDKDGNPIEDKKETA